MTWPISEGVSIVRRLMIFAHFSRKGDLSPAVLSSLKKYRPEIDDFVFVSASPLSADAQTKLRGVVDTIIEKENLGYDFSSWKSGLAAVDDLSAFDSVWFVNESILGPFSEAAPLFDSMERRTEDLVGVSASCEGGYHIQSYFFRASAALVCSDVFRSFWNNVEPLSEKPDVIDQYKIGLSESVVQAGFTLGALVIDNPAWRSFDDYRRLVVPNISARAPFRSLQFAYYLLRNRNINPVHYSWDEIVRTPLAMVKKELIRDNPKRVALDPLFAQVFSDFGVSRSSLRSWSDF